MIISPIAETPTDPKTPTYESISSLSGRTSVQRENRYLVCASPTRSLVKPLNT